MAGISEKPLLPLSRPGSGQRSVSPPRGDRERARLDCPGRADHHGRRPRKDRSIRWAVAFHRGPAKVARMPRVDCPGRARGSADRGLIVDHRRGPIRRYLAPLDGARRQGGRGIGRESPPISAVSSLPKMPISLNVDLIMPPPTIASGGRGCFYWHLARVGSAP